MRLEITSARWVRPVLRKKLRDLLRWTARFLRQAEETIHVNP